VSDIKTHSSESQGQEGTKHEQKINETGFTKKGLPHTSNFMNLEDHNLLSKRHITLKLFPAIKLW